MDCTVIEGFQYRGDGRWPEFELVVYPDPGWIAGTRAARLVDQGIPRSLMGVSYVSRDSLDFLEIPHKKNLICFGISGLSEKICVDPDSGEVLQIDASNEGAQFVNSNLEKFTQSVDSVIHRFPFYNLDDDLDDYERVSFELSAIINRIDDRGLTRNGFWETFVSDVSIGDYATEQIIVNLGG